MCLPSYSARFETLTLPAFGLACIIVAVLSFIIFRFANIYSIIIVAFFFILGFGALVAWRISRMKIKKGGFFRK